jgi:RanBP1 domain
LFNFNQQASQSGDRPAKYDFTAGASGPFGSAVQQDKPPNSPFQFGQTSKPPSSSAITFGSTPAPSPAAQTNNIFGSTTPAVPVTQTKSAFGSTTSAAPSSSNLFGAPTTAPSEVKPVNSPFLFGQAFAPPSGSGINFGSGPASTPPISNVFGSGKLQQSQQVPSILSSTTQQTASAANPFAHLNVPASPASNVFGNQEQKAALPATSNMFSVSHSSQTSTTSNLFGDSNQTPLTPSKSTFFSQQQNPPAPANNVFGNLSKIMPSTTQPDSQSLQASAGSVFGNKEVKVTNELFGNLNKPVDQSVTQPKLNGDALESGPKATPLFSQPASTANIFGASKSPVSPRLNYIDARRRENSDPWKFTTAPATNGLKSSGSTQSAPQASGTTFSPLKPLDAPASANQPPPNGMFPSLGQAKSPLKSNGIFSTPANSATPPVSESPRTEALRPEHILIRQQMTDASQMTEESMAHLVTPHFNDYQKQMFYQGYRIHALNNVMSSFFASVRPDEDVAAILDFYTEQRTSVTNGSLTSKRRIGEDGAADDHPSKRLKQNVQSVLTESQEQQSKRKLDDEQDQENENPSKRTRQTEPSSSARGLTNGEASFGGQPSASISTTSSQPWKTPSSGLAPSSETPLKRKADGQITKDSVSRSPLRQVKPLKTNGTVDVNLSGSSTSNIFRNILDTPAKSLGNINPERKMAPLPETPKDAAPRTNAFANLPGISSAAKSTNGSLSSSGTKGVLAPSSVSSQNPFAPNTTSETTNVFIPKPSTPVSALPSSTVHTPSALKPPTFDGKVNYLEQYRLQAEQGEKEKYKKALEEAADEDYDSEDDWEEFEANFKAKYEAKVLEERKAIEESRKKSNGFVFKPTTPAIASPSSKIETSQANVFSQQRGAATQPAPVSTALFGQKASSQVSNSISSSVNSSRTPTPAFGSSTGSVLDGHAPGKPIKFGGIFGHLSDADSGKGGDAEDDSPDEDSDAEKDSEEKDPTYQPDGENVSGPGTPAEETGPGLASAKKTNPQFSTVGSAPSSGTSTPAPPYTGGLFDRITKDSNGNVPRYTFPEEKENTQPSTVNPFRDLNPAFNKNTSAPTDNTWKPDSPIRFGGTTPRTDNPDATPIVSVTTATPTKTGSPSNIFGGLQKTTGTTPNQLSSLFGNIGSESKPAPSFPNIFGASAPGHVGFAFGASSSTSSLLPSAAASATTSRATTPGATTDGDNSGDGEAEGENKTEVNFSVVGPGEENEEVVHEVRAKALKFSPKEGGDTSNQWDSKGVGPLRVLKHKETGVSRILLRADPMGVIILNKGLLSGVKYEPKEKTVKFLTTGDTGTGLETWILQVKTPAFAKALAEVLEANKPT